MIFPRAGAASRRIKGDIVRFELVPPAGDGRQPWLFVTDTKLQLSSCTVKKGPEKGRESCYLMLNKKQCKELGFGHTFDGKAATSRQLKLNVPIGATGKVGAEVPLSKNKHGTSRKEGWEGAALRLMLVREAGVAAAGDDDDDSDDDDSDDDDSDDDDEEEEEEEEEEEGA